MTYFDANPLCKQAELYYYDFLSNEINELISKSINDHIDSCTHCQEQINRLKQILSQAPDPESQQQQNRSAVDEMLELHFAYIGKSIACNAVKPFLAWLSNPALQIRIPTPITVHLDSCRQCRNDLEVIRGLELNRAQLRRLSQFLADKSDRQPVSCQRAQLAIGSVASMRWKDADAKILRHLSKCRACARLLYQERQGILETLPENELPEFPCASVSASDIFDYALPYGIDPAGDEYAKFRESLTCHLRTCPVCLANIQGVHQLVCAIDQRPESEVVTTYSLDKFPAAKAAIESEDLYAGFPIKVEVAGRRDQVETRVLTKTIDFAAALRERISAKNLKPLFKIAVAAAAVILIASVLLLRTPTAGAATIEQVYKAIEKIKNVYIRHFDPDKTGPGQERWVSKPLNIYMTKTRTKYVLWDLSNGIRKSKSADTAAVDTTRLIESSLVDVKKRMSGSLGLMPFYHLTEIPPDAEWNRVTDKSLQPVTEGIEVYDLAWNEKKYSGLIIPYKWRFLIDIKTNLPQKIEIYQDAASEDEHTLTSVVLIEYLDEDKIKDVIRDACF